MRHWARELLDGQRSSALNALRGHLTDIGVVAPQGAQHAYDLKRLAADGEVVVPDCVRVALHHLVGQIDALDAAIAAIGARMPTAMVSKWPVVGSIFGPWSSAMIVRSGRS